MKKYNLSIICFALTLAAAVSCAPLDEKGLADGIGGDAENAVFMGNENSSGTISVLASDDNGASFSVMPRLARPASEPVEVTVTVDNATLEAYNQVNHLSVRPINADDIIFTDADGKESKGKITTTIKQGELYAPISVRLAALSAEKYPYDGRYAVPMKITDVKGPYQLLSSPLTTIVNLNRKIKTSVIHLITPASDGYTQRFKPNTPYPEEMTEWTLQYIAQFNRITGNNQTTGSMMGRELYTRISKDLGLQMKTENRDGVDTWTGKPVKEGEWLHVSYVYRKNGLVGNLSIYINGELQKTFVTSLLYLINNPDAGWAFGNSNVSDVYLRELRFWSRALSVAEIMDKYYLPEDAKAPGLEAYFPMTRESFDTETNTFKDLTGKWTWEIQEGSQFEIVDNVVFPATQLTIENE